MITKENKTKILERFENKGEKILVSSILDKAYRFEKNNKMEYTYFLNLNEFNIISEILNYFKIEYYVYRSNEYSNKKIIFFIPEYIQDKKALVEEYVTCLKIKTNAKNKLQHKDYMGSIYNLGLKNEFIGDVFVINNECYTFVIKSAKEYILNNLTKVGRNNVTIEVLGIYSEEIKNINVNILYKEFIVPSLRVDVVCSLVFNLSRNETKEKIQKGDLCINDKIIYYSSKNLEKEDIVSFRKCGKIIIKENLRNTKSGNIVLKIGVFS